jgi:hypothetical protein
VSSAFDSTWEAQARWSAVANSLKRRLGWARTIVLLLTIVGAVLVTLGGTAAGFDEAVGKGLALAGAAALALVPIIGKNSAGQSNVQSWVRARSVSEGLKTELYFYLARVGVYADAKTAESRLVTRRDELFAKANDLWPLAQQATPTLRQAPQIGDVSSYIAYRVTDQIDRYYELRVRQLTERLKWFRRAEYTLVLAGAALGAVAAGVANRQPAAWVPVVTTIAAAVTAHIAAERYEAQIISYSATAQKLRNLRDQWPNAIGEAGRLLDDEAFVIECEKVISSENQGWMAGWLKGPGDDVSG